MDGEKSEGPPRRPFKGQRKKGFHPKMIVGGTPNLALLAGFQVSRSITVSSGSSHEIVKKIT